MSEYPKPRYGAWGGNPGGYPYIPEQCAKEVLNNQTHIYHQCSRKKGYGRDGLFCKQHAKIINMRENK